MYNNVAKAKVVGGKTYPHAGNLSDGYKCQGANKGTDKDG